MTDARIGYSSRPLELSQATARFMSRVYTWMTGGILLTALVSTYMAQNTELVLAVVMNKVLFYGLMIAEFGLVIVLSAAIGRMNALVASGLYLLYAAMNGVTFSVLFLVYTNESIANVFLTTACGFAGLSAFGYFTKRDLGPVGSFCAMGLFGMLGFALLSFFFPSMWSDTSQFVYSIVGLVVFSGLTAYDTQAIKQMGPMGAAEDSDGERKMAIHGALRLYLDFINLFLSLLRLMGNRRD